MRTVLRAGRSISWALAVGALALPDRLYAQGEYVAYQSFQAWRSLTPELDAARVCGLTKAGHDLWAQGLLRLPASTFLRGDFRDAGGEDWAIPLEVGDSLGRCRFILIVTRSGTGWRRLFLQEIPLEDGATGFDLVWGRERQAIGIDFGRRHRLTSPARMTWQDGEVVQVEPGWVVEKLLIAQRVRWDPRTRAFLYEKSAAPEEWDPDERPR